jgi:hypothetical protein
MLEAAGFRDVEIVPKESSEEIIRSWNLGEGAEKAAMAADVLAMRPLIEGK